jgi:hypothetical protein
VRDELLARFPALTKLPPGCYVVGGAVRDLSMQREPADVDLACADPLAAAQSISPRVIRLGSGEHLSAWRVVIGEQVYDFAALEGGSIEPDLARRDFTINAMAVSLDDGALLDPHGGRRDLALRVVRMVDPANFDDDPLRMLKAVRMAVAYDFTIEPETLHAIAARAPRIVESARERIASELSLILSAQRFTTAVALLQETRLDGPLALRTRAFHADDVTLDGALALLMDEPPSKDARTLQRLLDRHDRIALYDAGERVARQLPPMLRALGRDDALDWPDFAARALLGGDELAALLGIEPGKELGRIKRALLEAQLRGEVTTRAEAERFVREMS